CVPGPACTGGRSGPPRRASVSGVRLLRSRTNAARVQSRERSSGNPRGRLLVVPNMKPIRIYTTRWCGYCVRAKALLRSRGLPFEEISLDDEPAFREKLHELTGGWTVPQITIRDEPIGGYAEVGHLDRAGRREGRPAGLGSQGWQGG